MTARARTGGWPIYTVTDVDEQTMAAVREHVAARGYPPSYRDIGTAIGIGPHAVEDRVVRLERKGLITRGDGAACRTIRIVTGHCVLGAPVALPGATFFPVVRDFRAEAV